MLDDAVVLVTGGTGSLGRCFVETVLSRHRPRKLIIFSRDEHKQLELHRVLDADSHPNLRFVIGDVRDPAALSRVMRGVDVVVHAAALKHVPAAHANPLEFVKTNILGAANVIDAAVDRNVDRVVALSSDKAASPTSVYGATKLCADRLFTSADSEGRTRFTVIRCGNFVGSRGSVIPLFRHLRRTGRLPVTDPRMTRFCITLHHGVEFLLSCLELMQGGEIVVPKSPSMRIVDVAKAVAPECRLDVVRIRPGERLHELLVSPDDARQAFEYQDRFVIQHSPNGDGNGHWGEGKPCQEDFQYRSDRNDRWLSVAELREMAGVMPWAQC